MPLSHVWWCQRDYLSIVSWTVWLKQLMRKIIFKFLYLVVWSVNASLEKISQQPLSSVNSLNMLKAERKHKNFSINQKKLLHQFCMENQNSKLKKNSQKEQKKENKVIEKSHFVSSFERRKGMQTHFEQQFLLLNYRSRHLSLGCWKRFSLLSLGSEASNETSLSHKFHPFALQHPSSFKNH